MPVQYQAKDLERIINSIQHRALRHLTTTSDTDIRKMLELLQFSFKHSKYMNCFTHILHINRINTRNSTINAIHAFICEQTAYMKLAPVHDTTSRKLSIRDATNSLKRLKHLHYRWLQTHIHTYHITYSKLIMGNLLDCLSGLRRCLSPNVFTRPYGINRKHGSIQLSLSDKL